MQIEGEEQRRLVRFAESTNPNPEYSPSGHILYAEGVGEGSAIWALPFSLTTLEATGEPFRVAERASTPRVSRNGTLVYSDAPVDKYQLTWFDRSGAQLSSFGEFRAQTDPIISPDGRRIAVQLVGNQTSIGMYEDERWSGTLGPSTGSHELPRSWSPSGEEILYTSSGREGSSLRSRKVNSPAEVEVLLESPALLLSPIWSPDERFLVYRTYSPDTKFDLFYREVDLDGALGDARPFAPSPAEESDAQFSPDGRFLAYVSSRSGRGEVYVRDFPDGAKEWRVSPAGGQRPQWRRDGRELFYLQGAQLMSVSLAEGLDSAPGAPTIVFESPALRTYLGLGGYAVSVDGQRILALVRDPNTPPILLHVVYNWFEEFRGREQD